MAKMISVSEKISETQNFAQSEEKSLSSSISAHDLSIYGNLTIFVYIIDGLYDKNDLYDQSNLEAWAK